MKKFIFLSALLIISWICFVNAGETASPRELVRQQYLSHLGNFTKATADLVRSAEDYTQGKIETESLRAEFDQCRQAFKKIEFLLDYLQPQDVKDHLNGAPLPTTERNAPRLIIMEPTGLQSIEELVYAEVPEKRARDIRKLSLELSRQALIIERFQQGEVLYDRHIFEALRAGLVRLMSLGLTGFDTPASGKAYPESAIAWRAMHKTLKPYLERADDQQLARTINLLFKQGQERLEEASTSEEFNLALFIREVLNPLYGRLADLQQELKIETAEESVEGEVANPSDARHIFSDEFLNPYYYTSLYRELDSDTLRLLGRYLFFDPVLSANMQRSCASCHQPEKAFTDGMARSLAFNRKDRIQRNAPTVINAIYSEKFFYDLRADKMENQVEHVIFNPHEFNTNYKTIFARLQSSSEYERLFAAAFPTQKPAINRYTLSAALSSYMVELRSFNSPVDRYLRGEALELSDEVIEGFNLFMGRAACGTCHFAPTFSGLVPPQFSDQESEVLGVLKRPLAPELDEDRGRIASGRLADEAAFFDRSFKTPGIRNVAFTAPYFHNGQYASLEEVVEFYNHGGGRGLGIDVPNQTLAEDSLNLNEDEIHSLIAFMEALSDTSQMLHRPERLPELTAVEKPRTVGGDY